LSSPSLFINEAIDFIDFRAFVEALKSGYVVRTAIRSKGKADEILATLLSRPSARTTISPSSWFRDILVGDAFDKALKGITYVLHIASPFILYTAVRLRLIFKVEFNRNRQLLTF